MMKKNSIHWLLWIFILTACSSKPEIEGTVKDYFGRPVQGVEVTIENSEVDPITDTVNQYL